MNADEVVARRTAKRGERWRKADPPDLFDVDPEVTLGFSLNSSSSRRASSLVAPSRNAADWEHPLRRARRRRGHKDAVGHRDELRPAVAHTAANSPRRGATSWSGLAVTSIPEQQPDLDEVLQLVVASACLGSGSRAGRVATCRRVPRRAVVLGVCRERLWNTLVVQVATGEERRTLAAPMPGEVIASIVLRLDHQGGYAYPRRRSPGGCSMG
jgi:hypothetical protein